MKPPHEMVQLRKDRVQARPPGFNAMDFDPSS